jgi:2-polyprenyl-6-hydroxyphenyl methylase / 3-demethylubiquinone-9 3-methyltransferase
MSRLEYITAPFYSLAEVSGGALFWCRCEPYPLYNAGWRRIGVAADINNQIYDELAQTWWDEKEFLHLLKVMVNPWRVPYFKDALLKHYGQDLHRVRLLDIGCGGGVLAEEFASIGCKVTGIDISSRSIEIARAHAAQSGLSIDYRVGSGTSLPFADTSFEAVTCCDVLEHIRDWKQVIVEAARVLVPGGLFFFDTINRTLNSRLTFIFGLQKFPLTRLMPADTHMWKMFITPAEITTAVQEHGMTVQDMKGGKITKNPLATLWDVRQQKQGKITFAELGRRLQLKLDKDLSLNYLGYARKKR